MRTRLKAVLPGDVLVPVDLDGTQRRLTQAELGEDFIRTPDHPEGFWVGAVEGGDTVLLGHFYQVDTEPGMSHRVRDEITSLSVGPLEDWRDSEERTWYWATPVGEFRIFTDSQDITSLWLTDLSVTVGNRSVILGDYISSPAVARNSAARIFARRMGRFK